MQKVQFRWPDVRYLKRLYLSSLKVISHGIDCEQPLFFSDLARGLHARASVEWQHRETRETRAAASPVSRLQSRAWLFACLGRFARRTKEKERLLVVYTRDDSQRRFLTQQSVTILVQCYDYSKQCRNNVATLCCDKNRRCESSCATSPK